MCLYKHSCKKIICFSHIFSYNIKNYVSKGVSPVSQSLLEIFFIYKQSEIWQITSLV